MELVVSDDHAGLRKAIAESLPEAEECTGLPAAQSRRRLPDGIAVDVRFSFYRLPQQHHKHLKSRLKRRIHVVRIFADAGSCLRLVRALAAEIRENWIEATRYLNMQLLKKLRKKQRA